ncbi:phage capsid protein [Bernardetia sp. Wsw4-3y2]|uniref:phage capsid protein n=1 Tax=Bernardetia sp. Wsw4-3y2 TaxID=3127471 RepID=UPI0030D37A6F
MAKPSSYATAQEIFRADLAAQIFNNNEFAMRSRDWSDSARGKTVNYSESGAKPRAKINSTTGHGTAVQRTDVARSYELNEILTEPTKLDWTDEYVTNYDKRSSILEEHLGTIQDQTSLRILFSWAPTAATNIVRTSGTARAAGATGAATGTRLAAVYADILKIQTKMNADNIPLTGRVMVIPPSMHSDLMLIDQFISVDYVNNKAIPEGVIGRILGFDVYVHAVGQVYSNAATPVPIAYLPDDTFTPYAGAATDNASIIFYHESFVTRALSPDSLVSIIDVHGGTEFSTTSLVGGNKYYSNERGVYALVETS